MAPPQTCTQASWPDYLQAFYQGGGVVNGYCRPEVTEEHLAYGAVIAFVVLGLFMWYMQSRHKLLSDFRMALNFAQVVTRLAMKSKKRKRTFTNSFADAVKRWPNKVALEFVDDGRKLTFKDIDIMANKFAQVFDKQGIKKGEVAAILMTNKPEYVAIELALAKLGVVLALLNHNIKGKPLLHSINVAEAKLLIFDADHVDVINPLLPELKGVKFVNVGKGGEKCGLGLNLDEAYVKESGTPPDPSLCDDVSQDSVLALVYTSGTTGLPKAAIIKHKRIYLTSVGFAYQFNIGHNDRIYCTLPLYHSAGGNVALGMMINQGATMILRSKFSNSNFFKDVHETKATVMQYIGELCRYLLTAPKTPYDRGHKLRLAFGNGLRKDVWGPFTDRYGIKEVGEFYGATEGNIVFFNYWRYPEPVGAIGKGGFLNRMLLGWTVVKFDVVNEEPMRDANGKCIKCKDGEVGELVAYIAGTSEFAGYYKNTEATEKKVLRDAFNKGEHWFRSGDLIMVDKNSYVYFVDRIGDTFRWRGENVSTTEVSQTLSSVPELDEVNIVGVEVPGHDGRACLAAVTLHDGASLNLENIRETAAGLLPSYAIPIFLRHLPHQETTGTFKHMKATYRTEGIDLNKVKDPMYWLNPKTKKYEPFTKEIYQLIATGGTKI